METCLVSPCHLYISADAVLNDLLKSELLLKRSFSNSTPVCTFQSRIACVEPLAYTPFASGSSDLWVVQTGTPNIGTSRTFDPSSSSTFATNTTAAPWGVNYGVGYVRGNVGSETGELPLFYFPQCSFGEQALNRNALFDPTYSFDRWNHSNEPDFRRREQRLGRSSPTQVRWTHWLRFQLACRRQRNHRLRERKPCSFDQAAA